MAAPRTSLLWKPVSASRRLRCRSTDRRLPPPSDSPDRPSHRRSSRIVRGDRELHPMPARARRWSSSFSSCATSAATPGSLSQRAVPPPNPESEIQGLTTRSVALVAAAAVAILLAGCGSFRTA
jgi:hypothetical protein